MIIYKKQQFTVHNPINPTSYCSIPSEHINANDLLVNRISYIEPRSRSVSSNLHSPDTSRPHYSADSAESEFLKKCPKLKGTVEGGIKINDENNCPKPQTLVLLTSDPSPWQQL